MFRSFTVTDLYRNLVGIFDFTILFMTVALEYQHVGRVESRNFFLNERFDFGTGQHILWCRNLVVFIEKESLFWHSINLVFSGVINGSFRRPYDVNGHQL